MPNQVTISAAVSDPSGVSGASLSYQVLRKTGEGEERGSTESLPMRQPDTGALTGNGTYAVTVGARELRRSLDIPAPAILEYSIQAFDGAGNRSESTTGTVSIEYCLF